MCPSSAQEAPKTPQEAPRGLQERTLRDFGLHFGRFLISFFCFFFNFFFMVFGFRSGTCPGSCASLLSLPFSFWGDIPRVPPYRRGDITPPETVFPILSFLDVFSNDFLRQDFRGFLVHLGRLLGSKFAFFSIFFLIIFWLHFWIDFLMIFCWFWTPRILNFSAPACTGAHFLQNRRFSLSS